MDHIDLEVLTVRQGAELESVFFIIVSSNSLTLSVFVMVSVLTFQKKNTSFFYFRLKCVSQNPSSIRMYHEIAILFGKVLHVKYQK